MNQLQKEMDETQKILEMHAIMTRQHIEYMAENKKIMQLYQENCVLSEMYKNTKSEEEKRIQKEEKEKTIKEAHMFKTGMRVRKKSGMDTGVCGIVERVTQCEPYDIVIVRKDERKHDYMRFKAYNRKKGTYFSKQSSFNFVKL